MQHLKTTWHNLASRYTTKQELIVELWAEIEKHYTEESRYYHNLQHLGFLVEKAQPCLAQLADPDMALFAIFYHDIIYSTLRSDNEQQSADLAAKRLARLGVPDDKIARCHQHILATKTHQPSPDTDTNYLLDFDLAVLGEKPEAYRQYAAKIRKEYSLVPDLLYNPGRKKVLKQLLGQERIFKTEEFYNKYEKQARENMEREIEELGG